jgi:hypothetical protein
MIVVFAPKSSAEFRSYWVESAEVRNAPTLRRIATVTGLAALLTAGTMFDARAQQPASLGQVAAAPSGWTFNVAPYAWMPTIDSTLNFNLPPALGGTVSAEPSVGFGDLLSHLNFATMVAAEARYDRFSLLTDFMYLNLGGTAGQLRSVNFPNHPLIPISGAVQSSESMNVNSTIWTLVGGYTLVQGDWGNVDVIAGFRYLEVNTRINYSLGLTLVGPRGNGATFGGVGSVSGNGNIWNGIGGFRGRVRIRGTGLFIPFYFDAGAGGSNLTWQIASGLGYRPGWADLSLTYRYLSFNQGNSAVVQHMSIGGPMLMVNFTF